MVPSISVGAYAQDFARGCPAPVLQSNTYRIILFADRFGTTRSDFHNSTVSPIPLGSQSGLQLCCLSESRLYIQSPRNCRRITNSLSVSMDDERLSGPTTRTRNVRTTAIKRDSLMAELERGKQSNRPNFSPSDPC